MCVCMLARVCVCVCEFVLFMEAGCHHGTWHRFSEVGASNVMSTCIKAMLKYFIQFSCIKLASLIKIILTSSSLV